MNLQPTETLNGVALVEMHDWTGPGNGPSMNEKPPSVIPSICPQIFGRATFRGRVPLIERTPRAFGGSLSVAC